MGTDIHLSAEVAVYDDSGEQTGWAYVPGPIIDCWSCEGDGHQRRWRHDGQAYETLETPCYWCTKRPDDLDEDRWDRAYHELTYVEPGKTRDTWYSDRNYRVFAALADVRNGRGFAGVHTHDPIEPIAMPRGVPADVTAETLAILSDEHSASWLYLDEVMAYDWTQPMRQRGVVRIDEYRTYVQTGRPDAWAADVSGGLIEYIDQDQANALLASGATIETHPNTCIRIEWNDTLDDYATNFLDRMKQLMVTVGEAKCRLVFDFDS